MQLLHPRPPAWNRGRAWWSAPRYLTEGAAEAILGHLVEDPEMGIGIRKLLKSVACGALGAARSAFQDRGVGYGVGEYEDFDALRRSARDEAEREADGLSGDAGSELSAIEDGIPEISTEELKGALLEQLTKTYTQPKSGSDLKIAMEEVDNANKRRSDIESDREEYTRILQNIATLEYSIEEEKVKLKKQEDRIDELGKIEYDSISIDTEIAGVKGKIERQEDRIRAA